METPGIRFEIVRVTPVLAAQWLSKPWVRQRSLSLRVVTKYARAMAEGRWQEPSLDPIAFTSDDELGNGQHRLQAVIQAGWVGDMLIAFDAPAESFIVHDTGRGRRASQFVRIGHAKTTAAIARLALWYDKNHPAPPRGTAAWFDNDEVIDFIDANEEALLEASSYADRVAASAGIPASVHGTVLFIAIRGGMDSELIESWVDGLVTGAGLEVSDPRLALRERLARHPSLRRDQVALWYLTTRAFNAFMHGRPLTKVQYEPMDPVPVVKLSHGQVRARVRPGMGVDYSRPRMAAASH